MNSCPGRCSFEGRAYPKVLISGLQYVALHVFPHLRMPFVRLQKIREHVPTPSEYAKVGMAEAGLAYHLAAVIGCRQAYNYPISLSRKHGLGVGTA